MSICNGCGGVVGRDCFNPQECEWISQDMARRDQERQYEAQYIDRVAELEREKAELVDRARKLTLDYAILTFDAMNGRMVNSAYVVQKLEELKSLPIDASVITGTAAGAAKGGE